MSTAIDAATLSALTPKAADRGLASMKSEDFFKLLIAELKQQDPLEPAKTSDMINQVSQIRSIELSRTLSDSLTQLGQQQHMSGASELLGKYVTATVTADDGTATETAGIVTGVKFGDDGKAVLELDTGQTIAMANVTHVTTADAAKAAGTSKSSTAKSATTGTAATTGTTGAEADKAAQTAKPRMGLFPWLSFDSELHV